MALKYKIDAATYAALPEAVKVEYRAEGDSFILGVEGIDTADELRRARDRERDAAANERRRREGLETQLAELQPKIEGVAALESSFNEKLETERTAAKAREAALTAVLHTHVVGKTAADLARELAPQADALLLPHITSRLNLDLTTGTPVLRVLDAAGKPSAATLDELKTEFATNPAFSSIIVASKASGGGAGGSHKGGGAAKPLAEMSESERIALQKSDPARFDKLVAESRNSAAINI